MFLLNPRYGSIGVNMWTIMSYGNSLLPWGAYPGHTLRDIGSGIGFGRLSFVSNLHLTLSA